MIVALLLTGLILPLEAGCARGCEMFHVSDEELTTSEARVVAFSAYRYRESAGVAACPTVDQLVDAKELSLEQKYDRWKSAFVIVCTGARIDAVSAGPDRRMGTEDDIVESVILDGAAPRDRQ
jgi:hypothetical protein